MKVHSLRVVMFAGGGIAHTSGGIGTFIRYLSDEWARRPGAPQIRVVDTRGQGGKFGMALHFAKAMALLVWLRIIGHVDLVHIHMSAYGSTFRKGLLTYLARLLGIPVIIHMHGSNFHKFYRGLSPRFRRIVRSILNQAQYVIALGGGWRDFLHSEIGIAPEKIVVIFNGVPAPAPPSVVRDASLHCAAAHIAFLGQLGERKGVPDLIAAFQSPQLQSRSWTATIAGDGAVEEFQAIATRPGLVDRVTVPGWLGRDDTSNLLHNTDIFVLPSHFEAMPIAILEAMAHGVPVITTPVGAIPEFLTDGESAILVPPGAREKLADAIARLLDDRGERRRLGVAGQRLFLEQFDIRVAADRILVLYESITGYELPLSAPREQARQAGDVVVG